VTANWLFTIAFTVTALWFLLGGVPGPGLSLAHRLTAGAHGLMGAAMIAMVWPWGPAMPAGLQVAVFAPATVLFLGVPDPHTVVHGRGVAVLCRVHHAAMAAAMLWMGVTAARSTSPSMAHDHGAGPVVGNTLGCYFVLAGFAWLAAVTSARCSRRGALDAAGHAVLSVGMGALLLSPM
jgi:hypothetical protein